MSTKPEVTEDTLFLLTDAQEAFMKHFGVEVKTHSTLSRYAKGVSVPYTKKMIRLGVVYSPGRARMISLRLWNKFMADLQVEYRKAMKIQDAQDV